jgi:hypothetical protein
MGMKKHLPLGISRLKRLCIPQSMMVSPEYSFGFSVFRFRLKKETPGKSYLRRKFVRHSWELTPDCQVNFPGDLRGKDRADAGPKKSGRRLAAPRGCSGALAFSFVEVLAFPGRGEGPVPGFLGDGQQEGVFQGLAVSEAHLGQIRVAAAFKVQTVFAQNFRHV